MVLQQQEDVACRRELEQRSTQRNFMREIEWTRRGGAQGFGQFVLGDRRGFKAQRGVGWSEDLLLGDAVGLREDRTQAFVACDEIAERLAQRIDVELPVE